VAIRLRRRRERAVRAKKLRASFKKESTAKRADRKVREQMRRSKQRKAALRKQRAAQKRRMQLWKRKRDRLRTERKREAAAKAKRRSDEREEKTRALRARIGERRRRLREAARRARAQEEAEERREEKYKAALTGPKRERAVKEHEQKQKERATQNREEREQLARRCRRAKGNYFEQVRAASRHCKQSKTKKARAKCVSWLIKAKSAWYLQLEEQCELVFAHTKCIDAKKLYRKDVKAAGTKCRRVVDAEERATCWAELHDKRHLWFERVRVVCHAYPSGARVNRKQACSRATARKTQKLEAYRSYCESVGGRDSGMGKECSRKLEAYVKLWTKSVEAICRRKN